MKLPTKAAIIALMGDISLLLAFFASLPYTLGEVADILPPKVKAWLTVLAGVAAGLLKIVQRIVERQQGIRDAKGIEEAKASADLKPEEPGGQRFTVKL